MKKSLLYIIGIASALFTSCENISEGERLIEIDFVPPQRMVLLEDYTGQKCVNCPEAHDVATELHNQYPDNLIVVCMHAGGFGVPAPVGLMQPEGNEYARMAGVEDYPSGVINRRGGVKTRDKWGAAVREEMNDTSYVQLELQASLSDTIVNVTAKAVALKQIAEANLQLWVLEDSIEKVQLFPGGKADLNYVHNHVYRASVNGVGGESVTLPFGETVTFERSCKKADDWVAENLSVVAFIYDNTGVLQAVQCKLTIDEPTIPDEPTTPVQ